MPLTRIKSLGITDGTIVNADINASAAIAGTKLSGAGKVLQVVQSTLTTEFSTTSDTFVTTGLSASITPSSASNKILILSSAIIGTGTAMSMYVTIFRGSTDINPVSGGIGFIRWYENSTTHGNSTNIMYLDSPSTTSSTSYSTRIRGESGGTAYYNRIGANNNSIQPSTLILMEIAV